MSVTAKILNSLTAILGGEVLEIGSRVEPAEMLLDGQRYESIHTIETQFGKQTLWETGYGGLSAFSLLVLVADGDVILELVSDIAGTPEYAMVALKAGVPFVLSGGLMHTTASVNEVETTMDEIQRVAVQHNGEEEDEITVRLLLLA